MELRNIGIFAHVAAGKTTLSEQLLACAGAIRATGGRSAMSVRLYGCRECPQGLGAAEKRRSVDPLDTGKYILAARSALEGGIFNI